MKISSYRVVSISVAIAVALWTVATWLDDDSRWLPADRRVAANLNPSVPRQDTPVKVDSAPLNCAQVERELIGSVESAQYCASDDDCTLFDYGYPIQCLTSVAKAEITALRLEYRKYESACAYRVYYDCPSGDLERQAVCRNNHCAVDLVGHDPLEDETLRYLGIQGR